MLVVFVACVPIETFFNHFKVSDKSKICTSYEFIDCNHVVETATNTYLQLI